MAETPASAGPPAGPEAPDKGPTGQASGRALNWHDLLLVLYGVLLSASLGAFAATNPPPFLLNMETVAPEEHYVLQRLWIALAVAILFVAFDAWYQFAVNGNALLSGKRKVNGVIVFLLIPAMVWTSFLPFQMLVRTLTPDTSPWLFAEPGARLFGYSLIVCAAVEGSLIFIGGLRMTRGGRSHPTPTLLLGFDVPVMVAGFMRLLAAIAVAIAMIYVGTSPLRQAQHVVLLVATFVAVRAVETVAVVVSQHLSRRPDQDGSARVDA